jgi:hypothetical protein
MRTSTEITLRSTSSTSQYTDHPHLSFQLHRSSKGLTLGLHRSLQKYDLQAFRQTDIQVFDADGMEHEGRDAASFEFQDKREGEIVTLV